MKCGIRPIPQEITQSSEISVHVAELQQEESQETEEMKLCETEAHVYFPMGGSKHKSLQNSWIRH